MLFYFGRRYVMVLDLQSGRRPKAVLFDLDGTLVDSMGLWKEIDIQFMKDRDLAMPESLQMDIAGMSMYETALYFIREFELEDQPEDLMDLWNEMARENYRHHVELKPGAIEFLQSLKDKGIKTGLATSNSYDLVQACFEGTGLGKYLDAVVSADEVKNGKPAPDVYLTCARKISVDPRTCIVFEDVIQGVQAARNAGMKVYAIDDPYSREHLDEKMNLSDGVISDFTEIDLLL